MNRRALVGGIPTCLALLISWSACTGDHHPHEHSEAHPTGHDHHEEGHGHGDTPTIATTLWGDAFELFSEHSPGEVGHPVSFLVHLTKLEDFRALEEGTLTLELEGPATLRGETSHALRSGIFRLKVTPEKAGTYRGVLRVTGPTPGVVKGIELKVFGTSAEAAASASEEDDAGLIEFLKEQQWGVPFGTEFVQKAAVVSSVVVSGRIDTPPGGTAVIGAPVTGRLVSPSGGLPRPGTTVRKGQVLASLIPAPSSPTASVKVPPVSIASVRVIAGDDKHRHPRCGRTPAPLPPHPTPRRSPSPLPWSRAPQRGGGVAGLDPEAPAGAASPPPKKSRGRQRRRLGRRLGAGTTTICSPTRALGEGQSDRFRNCYHPAP